MRWFLAAFGMVLVCVPLSVALTPADPYSAWLCFLGLVTVSTVIMVTAHRYVRRRSQRHLLVATPHPFQFSLRSLMIATAACGILLSAFITWQHNRDYHAQCSWGYWLRYRDPSKPRFVVEAFAVNENEPTVACFVRIDDPNMLMHRPPPWWKQDSRGYILIQNKRVPHIGGRLQLFVARDDEPPVRVLLDKEDAQKYFGIQNTEFYEASDGERFWDEVLQKKYLAKRSER